MSTPEAETLPVVRPARPPIPLPRTLEEQLAFGQVVVKSGLAPAAFKTAEAVVIAVQAGAELGLMPMQSLRMFSVINGKPGLNADAIVAVILASGKAEYFVPIKVTAEEATYATKRKGAAEEHRYTFTMEQAKRAKLPDKNPTYNLYPERMLSARSKSFLGRDVYPDVVGGIMSIEELADMEPETPERGPIPLPRRVGEEAPAAITHEAGAAQPNGDSPTPPAATATPPAATDGWEDLDRPQDQGGLPGMTPEEMKVANAGKEELLNEAERQELFRHCNMGGKRQRELKDWLAAQGVQSTLKIPRRLFEAAKTWAATKAERQPGAEG